jgi:hypothetical protein
MNNDTEVALKGNTELAESQKAEIVNKTALKEDGGYYKNVVSPEEYLNQRKEKSNTGDDLELKDEDSKKSEVTPLKHWNTKIQNKFDECTESQKKAWLDSFKIIEKGYVKQLNAVKQDLAISLPVFKEVEPYLEQISKDGMTPAQYVRTLIDFDKQLEKDPAPLVGKIINYYQLSYDAVFYGLERAIDESKHQGSISPYIVPLQKEISQLRSQLSPEAKEQAEANEAAAKIEAFYSQKDSSGKDMYPGAFDNLDDILALVQIGETLDNAYNLVINGETKESAEDNKDADIYDDIEPRRRPLDAREKELEMLRSVVRKITK